MVSIGQKKKKKLTHARGNKLTTFGAIITVSKGTGEKRIWVLVDNGVKFIGKYEVDTFVNLLAPELFFLKF